MQIQAERVLKHPGGWHLGGHTVAVTLERPVTRQFAQLPLEGDLQSSARLYNIVCCCAARRGHVLCRHAHASGILHLESVTPPQREAAAASAGEMVTLTRRRRSARRRLLLTRAYASALDAAYLAAVALTCLRGAKRGHIRGKEDLATQAVFIA